MSVYELALKYYPRLWDRSRLDALVDAARLTPEEVTEVMGDESSGITSGETQRKI